MNYGQPWSEYYYDAIFADAFAGAALTIEDLDLVPGSPLAYGSGLGAEARIQEWINGEGSGIGRPEAVDDTANGTEDNAVTLTAGDLLGNDSDPDGDAISITAVSDGAHGTAVLNGDGSVTYTPNADFFGEDTFSYTISDTNGHSDTATVTVTVGGTPDAPTAQDDTVTVTPNTAKIITVVGNDNDPDGDTLDITAVTQGVNGSVAINGNGTVIYTPDPGFIGADSFSYTVNDGNGGTDTALVTVTVTPFATPVFELSGEHGFDGSSGDVINLPHDANLAISEATIAFSFTADDVTTRQGLVAKDATNHSGGGHHLAIYIEDGVLNARFQDGLLDSYLSFGGLSAGQEYEVAATFGPNGVELYVDGVLIGADSGLVMSWASNQEFLQIGGLGWGSQSGQGDFTDPFSGEIADIQIYDQVLEVSQIEDLAAALNSVSGTAGDDNLVGTAVGDEVSGGAGNDILYGEGAGDDLSGGSGFDMASYVNSTEGVAVNLTTGTGTGGDAQGDQLTGIEHVQGSNFDDMLTGDAGKNFLYGLDGNDQLFGLAGDDKLFGGGGHDNLYGGSGAELLDGGAGFDLARYLNSGAGVTVNLATGTGSGGDAEGDQLVRIEHVQGSNFDDVLTGDAGKNFLYGQDGNDQLFGLAGDDKLFGGAGHDHLHGGSGAELLDGGSGFDLARYVNSNAGVTVDLTTGTGSGGDAEGDQLVGIEHAQGSNFDDILTGDATKNFLYGQDGNDQLFGLAGDDKLFGGAGHDDLYAGSGAELLDGGTGFDLARYINSSAGVTVDLTTGTGSGGDAEGDQLVRIEHVMGSNFDDVLTGDAGKNFLYGQDGNDQLFGLAGDDKLFGGAGSDTFIMASGDGADSIHDFVSGAGSDDLLDVSSFGFASLTDILNNASQVGGDVVITLDGTTSVALLGTSLASLHEDDFLFA